MAENCRRLSGTDYALSVTGIAGPAGGTVDKPVDSCSSAWRHQGLRGQRASAGSFLLREEIRDRASKVAINLLRRRLISG